MFTVILYGLAFIGTIVVFCVVLMIMWYYGLFTKVEKYKPSNYLCLGFHKPAKPIEKTYMKPFGIGGHYHKYYMQCGTCAGGVFT